MNLTRRISSVKEEEIIHSYGTKPCLIGILYSSKIDWWLRIRFMANALESNIQVLQRYRHVDFWLWRSATWFWFRCQGGYTWNGFKSEKKWTCKYKKLDILQITNSNCHNCSFADKILQEKDVEVYDLNGKSVRIGNRKTVRNMN